MKALALLLILALAVACTPTEPAEPVQPGAEVLEPAQPEPIKTPALDEARAAAEAKLLELEEQEQNLVGDAITVRKVPGRLEVSGCDEEGGETTVSYMYYTGGAGSPSFPRTRVLSDSCNSESKSDFSCDGNAMILLNYDCNDGCAATQDLCAYDPDDVVARSDLNNDGKIDNTDFTILQEAILDGVALQNCPECDLNGDEVINAADEEEMVVDVLIYTRQSEPSEVLNEVHDPVEKNEIIQSFKSGWTPATFEHIRDNNPEFGTYTFPDHPFLPNPDTDYASRYVEKWSDRPDEQYCYSYCQDRATGDVRMKGDCRPYTETVMINECYSAEDLENPPNEFICKWTFQRFWRSCWGDVHSKKIVDGAIATGEVTLTHETQQAGKLYGIDFDNDPMIDMALCSFGSPEANRAAALCNQPLSSAPATCNGGHPLADILCIRGAYDGEMSCCAPGIGDFDKIDGVTAPTPVCGNNRIEQGEECDFVGTKDGITCSNCLRVVEGTVCGNGGVPEAGEECDDGNNQNGDGCSASCRIETGDPEPALGGQCNDYDPFTDTVSANSGRCSSGSCSEFVVYDEKNPSIDCKARCNNYAKSISDCLDYCAGDQWGIYCTESPEGGSTGDQCNDYDYNTNEVIANRNRCNSGQTCTEYRGVGNCAGLTKNTVGTCIEDDSTGNSGWSLHCE